ncbi:hypothetical protein Smp_158570 [Schistosoma mansoni]|uniref:hypothetical protein n=1 Tax=Schistosoma mansoni TaxID=6183 RepID=UPI0001A62A86|nr:hypothetical protein Smp_158570 [Schistosoma mansoni]|eukprot:XP_018649218.1 hypothetical protein Smp_158570 [Schistosoma mansoni]
MLSWKKTKDSIRKHSFTYEKINDTEEFYYHATAKHNNLTVNTTDELKCFCRYINLHGKQITDGEIILQWTNQRFYSRSSFYLTQKINKDESYYLLDPKEHTLTVNTTDQCLTYEFDYVVQDDYHALSYSQYILDYIPQMFENIRYRVVSPTSTELKWDMKNNNCNKTLNTIIFRLRKTGNLEMLLLERASSTRMAISKENKSEFILSAYDPQLPESAKHKLGYFGIPTLVKIKSPTKQIFYDIKFRKKGSQHVMIKWKTVKITDKTAHSVIIFHGLVDQPLQTEIQPRSSKRSITIPVQLKKKYRVIVAQYSDGKPDWPIVIDFRIPCKSPLSFVNILVNFMV